MVQTMWVVRYTLATVILGDGPGPHVDATFLFSGSHLGEGKGSYCLLSGNLRMVKSSGVGVVCRNPG